MGTYTDLSQLVKLKVMLNARRVVLNGCEGLIVRGLCGADLDAVVAATSSTHLTAGNDPDAAAGLTAVPSGSISSITPANGTLLESGAVLSTFDQHARAVAASRGLLPCEFCSFLFKGTVARHCLDAGACPHINLVCVILNRSEHAAAAPSNSLRYGLGACTLSF